MLARRNPAVAVAVAVAVAPASVSVDVEIFDSANAVFERHSPHSRSTSVSEQELLHG